MKIIRFCVLPVCIAVVCYTCEILDICSVIVFSFSCLGHLLELLHFSEVITMMHESIFFMKLCDIMNDTVICTVLS